MASLVLVGQLTPGFLEGLVHRQIREVVIPAIALLQKQFPISLPPLFHDHILQAWSLSRDELDCTDLIVMEMHLDKVRTNHFKAATLDGKRRSSEWDLCLHQGDERGDISSGLAFMDMLTRTFGGSSASLQSPSTSAQTKSFFDLRSSAQESPPATPAQCTMTNHEAQSTLYPHPSVSHPCRSHPTFTVIKTLFSITEEKKDIPYPHANKTAQDKKARKDYTDLQRSLADKGHKPMSAMEFIKIVSGRCVLSGSYFELKAMLFVQLSEAYDEDGEKHDNFYAWIPPALFES